MSNQRPYSIHKTTYTTGSWVVMPFFFFATKRFAFPGAVAKKRWSRIAFPECRYLYSRLKRSNHCIFPKPWCNSRPICLCYLHFYHYPLPKCHPICRSYMKHTKVTLVCRLIVPKRGQIRWKDCLKIGAGVVHDCDGKGAIWVTAEVCWESEVCEDLLVLEEKTCKRR